MTDRKSSVRRIAKKIILLVFGQRGINYVNSLLSARRHGTIPIYYVYGFRKKIRLESSVLGFSELAGRIIQEGRTYLHYDRLYTLWQALGVTPESIVIEIGTYKGGSALFLHDSLRLRGKSNRLYVCDTFKGHPVVEESVDGEHKVYEGFSDVSVEDVEVYLSDCVDLEIVVGNIMETASRIPDKPVGFMHIDVDVYPATKFCLECFCPRLVNGGVAVIDDYGFVTCEGAKIAVDEYVSAHPEFRLFHLTTGQAVLVRWSNSCAKQ
jgi:O-methyltransferase